MRKFKIYVDGSCDNRQSLEKRFGGWGAVVIENGGLRMFEGGDIEVNSQIMEMMAVIGGLMNVYCYLSIGEKAQIEVCSDSAYVVNCFKEKWYKAWQRRNWLGVKNVSYWKAMLDLVFSKDMDVTFTKVKGHSGDEFNDLADKLAREARLRCEELYKED